MKSELKSGEGLRSVSEDLLVSYADQPVDLSSHPPFSYLIRVINEATSAFASNVSRKMLNLVILLAACCRTWRLSRCGPPLAGDWRQRRWWRRWQRRRRQHRPWQRHRQWQIVRVRSPPRADPEAAGRTTIPTRIIRKVPRSLRGNGTPHRSGAPDGAAHRRRPTASCWKTTVVWRYWERVEYHDTDSECLQPRSSK